MERIKEFSTLSEALLSKDPMINVAKASRCILMERLNSVECFDKEILQIVKKLALGYTPRIDIEITSTQFAKKDSPIQNKEILKNKKVLSCGVIGLLGLCLSACNSEALDKITILGLSGARLLGCMFVGGATFAVKSFLDHQNTFSIEAEYKVTQKVEDIIIELDDTFDCLKRLLYHNQLENQYAPILQWIQNLWAESDNEIQKDISKLLTKINYEFIEYDSNLSEYFDSNKTADVDKPMTTRPALRNKNSGEIVERGYVIIPL